MYLHCVPPLSSIVYTDMTITWRDEIPIEKAVIAAIRHRVNNDIKGWAESICINRGLLYLSLPIVSSTFPNPILTTAATRPYPVHVAPHGRPGLGSLEQAEAVTSIIHTWRTFAPVFIVFVPKTGQGRRKSRRFLQLSVLPTLPSPAPTCLAAVPAGSIHQAGAIPPMSYLLKSVATDNAISLLIVSTPQSSTGGDL